MKRIFTLVFLLQGVFILRGQNWAENIAPILFKNCTKCHNPSGVAPFSLLTYQNAYNYRFGMKTAVVSKTMPPWTPDPNYKHFANERILTDAEINAIKTWVDNGAPQGDPAKAPVTPTYNSGSQIQNPDLVLQMPTYSVNTNGDLYRCFAIPANLVSDKFIAEMELLPGNRNIVHHVLVFKDSTSSPLALDAADPLPGYTNFGGTGSNDSKLIMGYVPGQGVVKFPAGMGIKLEKGTSIILQVHYPGGIANQKDSTRLVIKFSPNSNLRQVRVDPILNHLLSLTNGPLVIPANQTKNIFAQFTMPADATFLGVAPHMHLIGRRSKVFGIAPNGDTIRLINVPSWDFNWQGTYSFPKLLKIPRGTVLKSETFYDNTVNNPFNPNNPPKEVVRGESTTDEMMLVYFTYTGYQAGDENIVVDSLAVTATHEVETEKQKLAIQCYPNPAKDALTLSFELPETDLITTDIFNLQGELIKPLGRNQSFPKGKNEMPIQTHDLPSGAYILRISAKGLYGVERFVKIE